MNTPRAGTRARLALTSAAATLALLLACASTAHAAPPTDPDCAPVAVFAVPGSGETNPQAPPDEPRGLLAQLTTSLTTGPDSRVDVVYVPYPAELASYPQSQAQGVDALETAVAEHQQRCPDASINLLGYSQGADVTDDLLRRTAAGQGDLEPATLGSAVLLGSPRRDPTLPQVLDAPGQGILGPRPARLGELTERTYEICAPDDPICSAAGPLDLAALREQLDSGAHRNYATVAVGDGQQTLAEVLPAAYTRLATAEGPRQELLRPEVLR